MCKRIISAVLGVTLCLSVLMAQQPLAKVTKEPIRQAVPESKRDLTLKSFANLHTLIRPHEQEWRHLRVHWLTDVVAARKRAAAQDKPIVICYTGGAGYNEPLGVC